jgi:hypothetical protein
MATESNFNPIAVSPKNAQGLMQLISATAARFNVRSPTDSAENIRGAMAYLRWLLAYLVEGDLMLTLAAYNAGEKAVECDRGVPPYAETRQYVLRILASLRGQLSHPVDPTVTPPFRHSRSHARRGAVALSARSVVARASSGQKGQETQAREEHHCAAGLQQAAGLHATDPKLPAQAHRGCDRAHQQTDHTGPSTDQQQDLVHVGPRATTVVSANLTLGKGRHSDRPLGRVILVV